MTKTNNLFILVISIAFKIVLMGCSNSKKLNQDHIKTLYFKNFSLFNLKGETTLSQKNNSLLRKNYVEVSYSNILPLRIRYKHPKRSIEFNLIDSFRLENKKVYIYSTENLLGGMPGKQNDYMLRKIRNNYLLFINFSDTIIVKKYDLIDARFESYNYQINVFIQNVDNTIRNYYLLSADSKKNKEVDYKEMYKYWHTKIENNFPKDNPIIMKNLPPE